MEMIARDSGKLIALLANTSAHTLEGIISSGSFAVKTRKLSSSLLLAKGKTIIS